MRDDAAVHRNTEGEVAGVALRLEDGEVVGERSAPASVLLRNRAQQQPELACRQPHFAIDAALRIPPFGVRHHLALEEINGEVR